jgi:glycosyltransferase involved in cell wall biosynthesis
MGDFVSFVIPTLNSEPILAQCLQSIRNQDVPADRYEILVADGGSRDRTVEIATQFGCRLVEATGLLAEAAKQAAFAEAKGDYIALVDADNELAGKDWLRRAVEALGRHPDAVGFESYYVKHPRDSHLNRLLTAEVLGTDPCVCSVATPLRLVERAADGVEVFELPADGGYPMGANGFMFSKALLKSGNPDDPYHEAAFFPVLIRQGRRKLVKARGCGVYHHYVKGLADFFRKRRRTVILHMLRKQEVSVTWDSDARPWRKLWALAYNVTFVGPCVKGVAQAIMRRDVEWLLYPAAAFISALGSAVGWVDYRRTGSLEAAKRMSMRLSTEMTRIK